MKPNFPLLALAIGAFGIGTTEFAPMGLLPVIARDLAVSIPVAGLLVTGYAIGVMVGAPIVTLATRRVPRNLLLVGLMGVFTLGNLLSALSTSYTMLLVARLITSLNHGAFFGVGSMVAAQLVAPEKRASALATMFMGLTIANIGGVPLAAWVGVHLGWRTAFAGIAGLGVVAMVALWLALPRTGTGEVADVAHEIRVLRQPAVLLGLAATVLGAGAMFTLLTYIVPTLQHEAGASPLFITGILVLVGLGFTVGNYLGGRLADRALNATLLSFLAIIAALMLVFILTMHSSIAAAITVFLWAAASFAVVPPLQIRVMAVASQAPSLASSVNVGAFNLGNALGAAVGGAVLAAGLGYPSIPAAGALVAMSGFALVLATRHVGQTAHTMPLGPLQ